MTKQKNYSRRPGYWHDYYAKNKEKLRASDKAYRVRRRKRILDALCPSCMKKMEILPW